MKKWLKGKNFRERFGILNILLTGNTVSFMKRHLFVLIAATLGILFYVGITTRPVAEEDTVYAEQEGELLVPQNNVAIAVLSLEEAGLSLTRADDIPLLQELQADFKTLASAVKVESLLSASRVISQGEEIIVSRAIPEDSRKVTDLYLRKLAGEIQEFPELTPFVNDDQDTLLFYIYFANNAAAADINTSLKELQKEWKDRLPFDYTGRAPIIAETESLLTGDIELTFPILALMVIFVFTVFKRARVVAVSLFLILLSMGLAYGFSRFLGLPDTPLVLLIPVFSLGLLSDYLIHYFYHYFHTPHEMKTESLRRRLFFPLSLTAISTITGFLSLSLINGSGHIQLGVIIAFAVIVVWFGVFFWFDFQNFGEAQKPILPGFQDKQAKLFGRIVKYRYFFFALIGVGVVWGAVQLNNLMIEPYPIEQLPETITVKQADHTINNEFYGTLPFFLEVDTGEKNGILKKDTLLHLDTIHQKMDKSSVGYAFSLLTVLKRMNYYFMGSEETLLSSTEFDDFYDALIEQYLLYYSSSVDPLEYEALLDSSYRIFSIKGLLYYESYEDLQEFKLLLEDVEAHFPEGWSLGFYGMANQLVEEHNNLRNNWVVSFLVGSFMIFITVLLFYRKILLALISLLPGLISMLISFGVINLAGISIDAFSIIFVAIITGLVVDYSIHTLVAIDQLGEVSDLEESFSQVIGYSGLPLFLSFVTSLLSFLVLFLSSFRGARSLGFILITSLLLSFFLSLYLIPLIILPRRLKKGDSHA